MDLNEHQIEVSSGHTVWATRTKLWGVAIPPFPSGVGRQNSKDTN